MIKVVFGDITRIPAEMPPALAVGRKGGRCEAPFPS